jgi:hypothetical protein
MQLHQSASNWQTQTTALPPKRARGSGAEESLENVRLIGSGNTRSIIRDGECDLVTTLLETEADRPALRPVRSLRPSRRG